LAQPVKQRILEMVDTALYHLMQQETAEETSTEQAVPADAEKAADEKKDLAADSENKSASSKRGTALYKLTSILGKPLTTEYQFGSLKFSRSFSEMLAVANQLEILIAQAMMMRRSEWQQHLQVELSSDRQTLRVRYWQ
jgi:hypothetical protein